MCKRATYKRIGNFTVNEVLSQILPAYAKKNEPGYFKKFKGHMVKMVSQRYTLFKEKGTTCVTCGLVGTYFGLDKPPEHERPHFNLYGINEDGEEVMMTKDHIMPKSKGGKNIQKNYQPNV